MRLEIPETANPNCYVFQLGFRYPVCVWQRQHYNQAISTLSRTFGEPARENYYTRSGQAGGPPVQRMSWPPDLDERRWYAGQRLWRARENPRLDFWLVFQKESDRTLAMMLIND